MTEQATSAASAAASTVTAAASGVADNVFSMFGGGAKKEKKDEEEDRGDNSGSAKAQKEANPEVNKQTRNIFWGDSGAILLTWRGQPTHSSIQPYNILRWIIRSFARII